MQLKQGPDIPIRNGEMTLATYYDREGLLTASHLRRSDAPRGHGQFVLPDALTLRGYRSVDELKQRCERYVERDLIES
jgi:hypothetical protein